MLMAYRVFNFAQLSPKGLDCTKIVKIHDLNSKPYYSLIKWKNTKF